MFYISSRKKMWFVLVCNLILTFIVWSCVEWPLPVEPLFLRSLVLPGSQEGNDLLHGIEVLPSNPLVLHAVQLLNVFIWNQIQSFFVKVFLVLAWEHFENLLSKVRFSPVARFVPFLCFPLFWKNGPGLWWPLLLTYMNLWGILWKITFISFIWYLVSQFLTAGNATEWCRKKWPGLVNIKK